MKDVYRLFCPSCRAEQDAQVTRCASCDGLLGVALTRALAPGEGHPFGGVPGLGAMWLSNPVLPIANADAIVSLGEGGTPCTRAAHLGADADVAVWFKNEAANPTGSFKDRQVSVGISHALDAAGGAGAQHAVSRQERGDAQFYVVSSGNVAAAAAAYSARAGAECWVIAAAWASAAKLRQVQLCGAHVVRVEGDSAEQLFRLAEEAAAESGWHSLSTAARSDPFNIVGARTIAGEIVEQMPAPDWVVAPVGGGGLLGSIWQGFQDAARLRQELKLPRFAAVQAAGCAPFVRAVEREWSAEQACANPWQDAHTIAGGLADDIPFDAHVALPAVRESGGLAVAVSEEDITHAQRLLAEREGLFIEPSGVVSVAGMLELITDGRIARGDTVCCLLTGSGLKDLASIADLPEPPVIGAELTQLRGLVTSTAE
ncbi:MAG: pyridoxal-phosphate dependent enzyme [Armatimonadota bacterium]|nr:MAG: pyridoxal-phosphate dependent enzyme [Armatimonadota bacterium]